METLKEGTYNIPEDLRVLVINPTTIRVQKRKARTLQEGEYRCKDCAHRIKGRALKSYTYLTDVCEMKPKKTEGLFYFQPYYGWKCEHFKLREK
jgi:hypothetical protein